MIDTGFVGIRYIDVSPRGLEMIKDCVSNFFCVKSISLVIEYQKFRE